MGTEPMTRISHDQLMKQALQERFADFLRLFAPEAADGLDLDAGVTFRNAETFTDLPQGALLVPDIVAEVSTRAGVPELVHHPCRDPAGAGRRGFPPTHVALLHRARPAREQADCADRAPLLPDGRRGSRGRCTRRRCSGVPSSPSATYKISLARLAPRAEAYLQSGNVLAAALAGIMGRSLRGAARARLYYGCLRRLLDAEQTGEINPATRALLGDVVETYLAVAAEDRAALQQQLEGEGGEIMALDVTELTFMSRLDLDATLRTLRRDIRKVVQARFRRLSPEVEAVISGTEDEEALNALFDKALAAQTENELLR